MTTPGNQVSSQQQSQAAKSSRANSLGIDQRTLEQVVKKLDQAAPKDSKPKRGFLRWPYPLANVEMLIDNSGGGATTVRVAARNLSCGGVGILHRSFLHSGTKVRVRLFSMTRGEVEIQGTICRCSFKGGVVHDIGIRFDKSIDIHEFATPDLMEERFTLETLKPEDLGGNVLYIEDSAMDTRLVKHYLRATKVSLTTVAGLKEALNVAQKGYAVIMCDYHLPDGEAPDIIKSLRSAGVTAPIIAVTSDNRKVTRDRLRESGVSAFLAKPLTEERVHRALGEFLLAERWAEKDNSMGQLDPESMEVIEKAYKEELFSGRDLLLKLAREENSLDAALVCGRLGKTARSLKLAEIAALAETTGQQISATKSCAGCSKLVQSLTAEIDKLGKAK